jgi:L-asparagine transporter-like permease
MTIAIGLAAAIYIAVALGVFGTLGVDEVIAAGPTAIAVAAQPVLGEAGYWLMSITALFATAGATNAGLYPAAGLCEHLASTGQFPPIMGRRLREHVPVGLLVVAIAVMVMVVFFDLSAIASIGSAVALMIFGLVTTGHVRIRSQTGARLSILLLAIATTGITLLTFIFTTLVQEPASILTLIAIVVASLALDLGWSRSRGREAAVG